MSVIVRRLMQKEECYLKTKPDRKTELLIISSTHVRGRERENAVYLSINRMKLLIQLNFYHYENKQPPIHEPTSPFHPYPQRHLVGIA